MSPRDPFGTAGVRDRVLATWTASPARLREDANAEEDLRLGGYRDRVVVELAQNAADAAAAAGAPGHLRLSLSTAADGSCVLAAANTGRPLDADGVGGLATLRASAKREGAGGSGVGASVGRFGVGFSAVLALTDEPMVLSHNGSVRFSRADTAELVSHQGSAALTEEVRRRDGQVPVLRLPFEAEGAPPEGFSTVVILPLRDQGAVDLARRLLDDVDDALLLALPALGLVEVDVDGERRSWSDVTSRWLTHGRSGAWTPAEQAALLADRPVEEAQRPWWSVLWALPRDGAEGRDADRPAGVAEVVHAPTPTDEPLRWPALLLATFPLDPSRRHLAAGPLTDRLVAEAAGAWAELLVDRAAAGSDVLPLVPVGLGAGPVDSALRAAALTALREAPLLVPVEGGSPVRPRDAVVLDGPSGDDPAVLAALAPWVGGLVAAPAATRTALRSLEVRHLTLSDVVEALPDAADPGAWGERYDALAALAVTAEGVEALGVLPVPLADGRVVRGPRGLLLPGSGLSEEALGELAESGVRLVHPAAERPLLARLGAVPARARQILEDPAVRELVEGSPESEDPETVAATVLSLVQAALDDGDLHVGELGWLGDLALPDTDDELAPASALALPGTVAEDLFDPDEIGLVSASLAQRWGPDVLAAVGVLVGVGVLTLDDVDLTDQPEELLDLDGFAGWADEVLALVEGASVAELVVVRDLDATRPEAWPALVRALAAEPLSRRALVEPVLVRDLRGRGRTLPSYTAWWLRRELDLAGHYDPSGDQRSNLVGLLDPAPGWVAELDPDVRRVLGVVNDVDGLDPQAQGLVLARLADPQRVVEPATLLALWGWLARLASTADGLASDEGAPTQARAFTVAGVSVARAESVVVVDSPMWLQRGDLGAWVVAPAGRGDALADALDLALATERWAGEVTSHGDREPVPDAVVRLPPPATGGWPERWHRHAALEVDGQPVRWWVDGAGGLHAQDLTGLAAALAWSGEDWSRRRLLELALTRPNDLAGGLAEASFE